MGFVRGSKGGNFNNQNGRSCAVSCGMIDGVKSAQPSRRCRDQFLADVTPRMHYGEGRQHSRTAAVAIKRCVGISRRGTTTRNLWRPVQRRRRRCRNRASTWPRIAKPLRRTRCHRVEHRARRSRRAYRRTYISGQTRRVLQCPKDPQHPVGHVRSRWRKQHVRHSWSGGKAIDAPYNAFTSFVRRVDTCDVLKSCYREHSSSPPSWGEAVYISKQKLRGTSFPARDPRSCLA